jgi:hypothetical protein
MKIMTDAAGTQSVSVDDLEHDPVVARTIKRLREGFVAEQAYRMASVTSDTRPAAASTDTVQTTSESPRQRTQPQEPSNVEPPKKHRQAGEKSSEG